jgi:hypothetical protein
LPLDEKGDPRFNLNDAEPITEVFAAPTFEEPKPDFTKIDEKFFGKKSEDKLEIAQSAITPEDLEFERQLQAMHVESVLPRDTAPPLEKEVNDSNFLGDHMDGYTPAKTLNELEQQVFAAKTVGADSIEATEEIIKYYTRTVYPDDVGYFIFKDIKVFIPGRISGHIETDKQNISEKLRGISR